MQQHKPQGEELYALSSASIQAKPCALEHQAIGHNSDFQLRLLHGRQSAMASLLAIHRIPLVTAI